MLTIAHFSDIHIHNELDPILARYDSIGAAIASTLASSEALVIIVTGDIAFSGGAGQYELALTFFKRIEQRIRRDFSHPIKWVLVPGNHDCDFSQPQDLRNLVLKQIAENPEKHLSSQLVDTCIRVQDNFFAFLQELTEHAVEPSSRLRFSEAIEISGVNIVFDCLNMAWVSQLSEDKVTFPADIIPTSRDIESCVVTVLHHPFNWLHPSAYREFRRRVRGNSDFVFSGHEHQWNVLETDGRESGRCVQFEGDVLQDDRSDASGFTIVALDVREQRYRTQSYQWSGANYARQELGSWAEFRRFELVSPSGAWVISKAFGKDLSDLGVALRVGGRADIALEDLFVFPDLEASPEDGDEATTVQGDALIQAAVSKHGFVLQGDERSGRTSLLKHLYRRMFERNIVPLLVPAHRLTRATDDEIESLLDRLVEQQYGRSADQYLQLPLSERALLVDDFDEVPIRSEKARQQLLSRLRSRCGILVLSVSDVFDATYLSDERDTKSSYEDLPKYRVLPFGHLSRAKLIRRWVTLDADEFLSSEDRIRRFDEAVKYVNFVMQWNVVPCYPIYLLTLLQAQKTTSPDSFKDSGLGYYYQFLISDAMLGAGVAREKLTDVMQYCTQLAWWFNELGRSYSSMDELERFNDTFTEQWIRLDYKAIFSILVKSRIVKISGSVIEFRYSYIHYFFIAKYLSENFDSEEVRKFVSVAAEQLYVRSKANILVFLTHFSNRPEVIAGIVNTLNAQFEDLPIAQFALREESVEDLLRQLPNVVYGGGNPEENREEEARQRDELTGDMSDGFAEQPESEDVLSLPARMTVVFKSVEILGQILRTQASRLQRPRREALVRDMLNGPLRSLEMFYSALREGPDVLVADFESRLAEDGGAQTSDDRRALAQRVVGALVLAVTFAFIRKAAEAVGAEAIEDDLRVVAHADGNIGYKLVRIAAILDGQRPLPRVEIEEIRRASAGSLIVDRVLQVLVVYHMYMFKTSYQDIRWARDVLDIPDGVRVRALLSAGQTSRISSGLNEQN